MASEDDSPIIGIDLGTTYSCVAVVIDDDVKIIPCETGNHVMASCVLFKENGQRVVGNSAKDQSYRSPMNTIYGMLSYRTFSNLK